MNNESLKNGLKLIPPSSILRPGRLIGETRIHIKGSGANPSKTLRISPPSAGIARLEVEFHQDKRSLVR